MDHQQIQQRRVQLHSHLAVVRPLLLLRVEFLQVHSHLVVLVQQQLHQQVHHSVVLLEDLDLVQYQQHQQRRVRHQLFLLVQQLLLLHLHFHLDQLLQLQQQRQLNLLHFHLDQQVQHLLHNHLHFRLEEQVLLQ